MTSSRRLRLDLMRYYRLPSVQVSLSVVLAFFITAFFIMFAIRPTLETIAALQKEIEESRKTVTQLETKVAALNSAAVLMEKIRPQLPLLDQSIPGKGSNYNELTLGLEALAQNTGAALESFTVGEALLQSRLVNAYTPNKKQEVKPTELTIKVNGEYSQLDNFLRRLSGAIRLTDLESVSIIKGTTRVRGSETTGELSMVIVGKVFYMIDPSAVTKVFPEEKGR